MAKSQKSAKSAKSAKSRKIETTKAFSKKIGSLAKGCQLCIKGQKSVLFVTGICPRNCAYCPISDQKHQTDITFINEWPTNKIQEIIEEVRLCDSKGAGFTGGDPLSKIHRTCTYIKKLKEEFGKKFHIHLYTSFNLCSENNMKLLYDAGLDEIRFHADIDDSTLWNNIDIANNFEWDVGIEIPVIPKKKQKTQQLMKFFDKKIKFMNLNELEVSDAKANKLHDKGFITKDSLSYGVKGSEKLAKELLDYSKQFSYNVHYCTATLKDRVQLASRIKRRAKNVKKPYDIINEDGLLIRGAIYLHFLLPTQGYKEKLNSLNKQQRNVAIDKLKIFRNYLMREYEIPPVLIEIDKRQLRLLTNIKVVSELAEAIKQSTMLPAIVTEYPTWDALIVELEWL